MEKLKLEMANSAKCVELKERDTKANELFAQSKSGCDVKLPKGDLPKFCGDILKWKPFFDSFQVNVHLKPWPAVSKFTVLKQLLEGDPLAMVEMLPLTEAAYKGAYDSLCENYGRDIVLNKAYRKSLVELPPAGSSVSSVEQTQLKVESLLQSLESIGEKVNSDTGLAITIQQKFQADVYSYVYERD